MYTNTTGIKVYQVGDTVRVGKGKVEWEVIGLLEGEYLHLKSPAGTKRYADWGTVTYIRNDVLDEIALLEEENAKAQAEEPVVETSAYAKAVLFALNKLQKHVYAGTVRKNVKAKRRALNARQKASRKANR